MNLKNANPGNHPGIGKVIEIILDVRAYKTFGLDTTSRVQIICLIVPIQCLLSLLTVGAI